MIDKMDFVVPHSIQFTGQCEQLYREAVGRNYLRDRFGNPRYQGRFSLSPIGIDGLLHYNSVGYKNRHHKIELFRVGEMTMAGVIAALEKVVLTEPEDLPFARLDTMVDLPGVTVGSLRTRLRVLCKKNILEFGNSDKYVSSNRHDVETLYLGCKPDQVRVYDKVAESWFRYKQQAGPNASREEFQKEYGFSDTSQLTRIERQLNGRAIPEQVRTLRLLKKNASSFQPFVTVQLLPNGVTEPDINKYPLDTYLRGLGLRWEIERNGWPKTRNKLNKKSPRNVDRILRKYADFLPANEELKSVPDLNSLFHESLQLQLGSGSLARACLIGTVRRGQCNVESRLP